MSDINQKGYAATNFAVLNMLALGSYLVVSLMKERERVQEWDFSLNIYTEYRKTGNDLLKT